MSETKGASLSWIGVCTTVGFAVLSPGILLVLLLLKGMPGYAMGNLASTIVWIYQVSGLAAVCAGILVSFLVIRLVRITRYFHWPYDFGRCFSLGAISGAFAEGLGIVIERMIWQLRFSGFWVAGGAIAGCLSGALLLPVVLWRLSVMERKQAEHRR